MEAIKTNFRSYKPSYKPTAIVISKGVKRKNFCPTHVSKRRRKELNISLNLENMNTASLPSDILSKLTFEERKLIPDSEKKKFFQICQELQAIKKVGIETNDPSSRSGRRGSRKQKRNRRPSYNEDESEQAICEFCQMPSTLRISGKSYLVASKTQPGLKICNACKSYEYRHGKLVTREERRRQGRNQRNKTRARSLRLQREAQARQEEVENNGPQPGTIYFPEDSVTSENAPLVLTPLNLRFPEPPNKLGKLTENDNVESPVNFRSQACRLTPHTQFLRSVNTPTEGFPSPALFRNTTNVRTDRDANTVKREKPYFTFPPVVDSVDFDLPKLRETLDSLATHREITPDLLSSDNDSEDFQFFMNDDTDSGSICSDFMHEESPKAQSPADSLGLDTLPPLPSFTPRTVEALNAATYVICFECSKPLLDECQLVLCMECDKIFHKKCFKNLCKLDTCKQLQPLMVRCSDHGCDTAKDDLKSLSVPSLDCPIVESPRLTDSPRSTPRSFVNSLTKIFKQRSLKSDSLLNTIRSNRKN